MKPKRRTRYISIPLTPEQIRLLYVEMTNLEACCEDAKLGREYGLLARKFNKHREAR